MKTDRRTTERLLHAAIAAMVAVAWSAGTAIAAGAPSPDQPARDQHDTAPPDNEPQEAAENGAAAPAPQPGGAVPNQGRVSLGAGMDIGSSYFFRGIVQETDGFIGQPYLEGAVTVHESETGLTSAAISGGVWNSMHSGPTGLDGDNGDPQLWYEADFYTSLALGFDGGWDTSLTYTAYMSPNSSFGTVKELAVGAAYDGLLGAPYATLAFELDGQADGGANEGVYLELGAEVPIPLDTGSSVSFSVPVALGLSLSDYYEHPVTGEDHAFGFFEVGALASVPFDFMPAEYGSWELTGGVKFLRLGETLEALSGGDNFQPIVVAGISISY